jgi:polysaccharide biosynthesis protein PslH
MARILILTPQLPYPPQALTGFSQGTTIRNFNLIAGLSRRHTVDLLTFHAPAREGPASTIDDGRPTMETFGAAAREGPGLLRAYCRQVVTAPPPVRTLTRRAVDTVSRAAPDMALRLETPAMHARLAGLLRGESYDVLQVEGIEMAPYALPLSPAARPLFIFDDHNAEYVLQQRAFSTDARRPRRWVGALYSLIQWQKLARYERRVCRAADRVAAVSETDRQALQRLAPGLEVTAVPNGVDLDFYRPGGTPSLPGLGPQDLVFTGKMDYRPNVDAVLWFADEVLPLITARFPGTRFYVVGQSPHARLAPLAGRPDVVITGRVPDTRPYIAGAGVYVIPLRIGGGTRLKVLEAMAMGQGIVSTRLGCDGFPFEDGREVLFADEPAAFADAVVRLLQDREQARTLGRAARAFVEANYGWDAIVPRMEALYR